ncbi:hypothetical protein CU097_002989 [Rhizopus azygosporus]|uniref:Uncharacterized protein n=1 Tax=Rhizopus azygosporus TaxID=86630 RepID=A0A367JLT2_RHIAZ|nr:hypothetical protein CU097_002989 [Rhizopus azygosporus]
MDERRRQRRQQRILASGQSRLGKITSTAFPEQTHFSTKRRDSTEDPSEELGAPPALLPQLDDPFLAMSHNNMNDNPFFANNPFFTANPRGCLCQILEFGPIISDDAIGFIYCLQGKISYGSRSVRFFITSKHHLFSIYFSILVLCSCRTHFTNSSDDVS